jgi:hypothetical protein
MRVGLMLGLLATLWLCAASGAADWAIRGAISRAFPVRPSPQQTSPLVPQAPANPGLNLAKTRLRELAPNICAAATDLDNPSVSQSADETTYTWTYLTRPTPTSAVVQKFSLTLGPDGVMRHMGASK